MASKPASSGLHQQQLAAQQVVVEVAASSSPVEVITAIVNSASAPAQRASNPNRWLHIGFFFVLIFGCIVYFREEIYTFTTDVHKYPILSVVEALQVRTYLGSGWTFGTGQDTVKAIDASKDGIALPLLMNLTMNATGAAAGR